MAYPTIQWSRDAHKADGYGHTRDREGNSAVRSRMGYLAEAYQIANIPVNFADEDIVKAANIIGARGHDEWAQRLKRYVDARKEGLAIREPSGEITYQDKTAEPQEHTNAS